MNDNNPKNQRYEKRINEYIAELKAVIEKTDSMWIQKFSAKINETMLNGKKIFIFGNGGCSSLASHFSTDVGKVLLMEHGKTYRIISLNDNISTITAWANDTGYENIFWRQLQLYMEQGDLVFALSGSGNSDNIISAARYAKENKNFVIALAGHGGGRLYDNSDLCYCVDSHNMQVIEDVFGIVLHSIFVSLRDCK